VKYRNNKSGKIYRQICISNATATKPDWYITMVYQNVETGEIWSRKLEEFLASNTQIDVEVESPRVR